jgi:hypothetical protein
MNFFLRNDFIYYSSKNKTSKLCISWSMKKDIYRMIHNDNHHCEFHKAYTRVSRLIYIRHMIKKLRKYIHHCKLCLENQIKRYSSYDELNLIRIMTLFFHTIIIYFVVSLSLVSIDENALLTIIDKFIKRISIVSRKNIWDVSKWARAWLNALQREDWEISRAIISNRDSKFLDFFWTSTFRHMKMILHFTTAYHSSANDQSKRTNQTIEIVIRFILMKEHIENFTKIISFIQSFMNNASSTFTELSFNEILYDFKIIESLNLLNDCNSSIELKKKRKMLRIEIEQIITFANVSMKIRYDFTRTSLNLNFDDSIYVKLHKEYIQSSLINRKFSKQRLKSVKILKKIEKLVYRLEIFNSWKIHSIISAIHLKSASVEEDSYNKEAKESESIKDVQEKIKDIYEIERILVKRLIKVKRSRTSRIQYRVKWLNWENQHNQWIDVAEMNNAKDLVNDFETKLFERIFTSQ